MSVDAKGIMIAAIMPTVTMHAKRLLVINVLNARVINIALDPGNATLALIFAKHAVLLQLALLSVPALIAMIAY